MTTWLATLPFLALALLIYSAQRDKPVRHVADDGQHLDEVDTKLACGAYGRHPNF